MASTYTALHYHIIFSTRGREPNISIEWRERLHQYLAGLTRSLDGYADCVGGVADHVHMLVSLGADQRVSDFMREMKKRSSLWIHEEIGNRKFRWQEGYAAFSVSSSARESVRKYISNQEDHHRKGGFREELIHFLRQTGTEFNERYLD